MRSEPRRQTEKTPETQEVGHALQAALGARGCALPSADARALALELLRLCKLGLLVPVDDIEGPHVHNMGPSKYKNPDETP